MLDSGFPVIPSTVRRFTKGGMRLWVVGLLLALLGCATGTETARLRQELAAASPSNGAGLFVVDCLLPGQIRKLGRSMIYLTPQRPIKTTAQDCEIRGGEYVAYDRSDYATALKVWLPQAKEGDKIAQTYVGEIYEKGLGVPPDYALSVEWYRPGRRAGIRTGADQPRPFV
jgi:hypothetical protein